MTGKYCTSSITVKQSPFFQHCKSSINIISVRTQGKTLAPCLALLCCPKRGPFLARHPKNPTFAKFGGFSGWGLFFFFGLSQAFRSANLKSCILPWCKAVMLQWIKPAAVHDGRWQPGNELHILLQWKEIFLNCASNALNHGGSNCIWNQNCPIEWRLFTTSIGVLADTLLTFFESFQSEMQRFKFAALAQFLTRSQMERTSFPLATILPKIIGKTHLLLLQNGTLLLCCSEYWSY